MENKKPTIICLTPVRNEEWILDTFLQCTSTWADYIIIADQKSTDNSREIALKYPKVILIENNSDQYNESERQKLLINEARKIPGERLLIALDADEFFTGNFNQTKEWEQMLKAKPGTVFGFKWLNLLPGYNKYWLSETHFPWAFMDDGREHRGWEMHSPRVPLKTLNIDGVVPINEIGVLHYQYIDWLRMESKHRYYQCLERIKSPHKSAIEIYRAYHHMYAIPQKKIQNAEDVFFTFYEKQGIQIRNIQLGNTAWFDEEVLCIINEYGKMAFHKEDIWEGKLKEFDCRNLIDKFLHTWLRVTNKFAKLFLIKKADSLLKRWY